jgi:hypothetical protein
MFLQDMPNDIIDSICSAIVKNDREENCLIHAKKNIITIINEQDLTISPCINRESLDIVLNDEAVNDIITNYVFKILTQNQINNIIIKYGINKAIVLLHDWHSIGLGDSSQEICEEITDRVYIADRNIVEIIIKDEIGFHCNWRNNTN